MRKLLMLGGVCAVALTGASQMAHAVSDNLTMNAEIIATLTIDCSGAGGVALDFGTIDPGTLAGTVVVDTANGATNTGDATYLAGAASGQCTLTGENGYAYDMTFGAASVDDAGAGAAMTVDTWVVNIDAAGDDATSPYSGTISLGTDVALIGATLHINAAQLAGLYSGTVQVDAVYQ